MGKSIDYKPINRQYEKLLFRNEKMILGSLEEDGIMYNSNTNLMKVLHREYY